MVNSYHLHLLLLDLHLSFSSLFSFFLPFLLILFTNWLFYHRNVSNEHCIGWWICYPLHCSFSIVDPVIRMISNFVDSISLFPSTLALYSSLTVCNSLTLWNYFHFCSSKLPPLSLFLCSLQTLTVTFSSNLSIQCQISGGSVEVNSFSFLLSDSLSVIL